MPEGLLILLAIVLIAGVLVASYGVGGGRRVRRVTVVRRRPVTEERVVRRPPVTEERVVRRRTDGRPPEPPVA